MAEAGLIIPDVVERTPDLVHRVRGLQYFSRHLAQGIAAIARREGLDTRLDRTETARLFIDWVDDLGAQKSYADVDRRDYIVFGAGLLMRRLIAGHAIRTAPLLAGPSAPANPLLSIWPEGYIATAYCLTVLDAVLRQENLEPIRLHPEAGDERTWESFHENCGKDPGLAIPFLDLFVGNTPNWDTPTLASARPAMTAH